MKILVMSDSHGDTFDAALAVEQEPEAKYVFHLGDGEHDIDDLAEKYTNRDFIRVRGNCDFLSNLNTTAYIEIEGVRIFAAHGHTLYVRDGYTSLYFAAKERNADIALFGHTHSPYLDNYNGVRLFNPGSIHDGRYGLIVIDSKGISCFHKKVRYD